MKLSVPTPKQITIGTDSYRLVAFYYNGRNTGWDDVYNAPFLGNFWVTEVTITVVPYPYGTTGKTATFHTAEAAFQATKWWDMEDLDGLLIRPQFEACKDGDAAFQLRKRFGGDPRHNIPPEVPHDPNYAGLQQDGAMRTVLAAKFQDKDLRAGLLATGDAYLLEHNAFKGIDSYWSGDKDGINGQNRLGKLLMDLRRDCGGQGEPEPAQPVLSFTRVVKEKPD